jgi:short-subunit dehydrogenase
MKRFILTLVSMLCLSEGALAANWCASNANLTCMKNALNGEARGEGYNGMLMVGKTIATRMARGYKNSVCSVVNGAGYATKSNYPSKGQANKTANSNIAKAALAACKMGDQGVTHFHSYSKKITTKAPWSKKFAFVGKVGHHYFFNAPMYAKASYELDSEDMMVHPAFDDGTDDGNGELIQEPDYILPDDTEPATIEI